MTQSKWIALVAVEVIALCCCVGLFALIAFGTLPQPATPTLIAQATASPTTSATSTLAPTLTPERTFTLVIQSGGTSTRTLPTRVTPGARTPTRSSSATIVPALYNIIVPTPTAPRVVYQVDFNNTFVVSTYAVTGKTVNDLGKSLEASAMSDPHEVGNRYYARTDWNLSGHWLWKETSLGCEVDKGSVNVAITMTLPALATTTGVPTDVLNRWNTFIRNTQTHEVGHVKLVEQGARDYQRDLGNFPPASNCEVIQPSLRSLFDKSFSTIDKANVNYDAQTQHGFTQGAVFP